RRRWPGGRRRWRGSAPRATPWGCGHRGVDLAAPPGTPVLAAGPGVVSYAAVLAGRGVVTVKHNGGLRTTYEPVVVATAVGRQVAAGDVIGTLVAGHPGCPRIACLHWGLLRGKAYLDPLSLLDSGPIRLLPLAGSGPVGVTGPRTAPVPAGRPKVGPSVTGTTATGADASPAADWARVRQSSTAGAVGLTIVGVAAL